MAEPMTDERLAEIQRCYDERYQVDLNEIARDADGLVAVEDMDDDIGDLLAEVGRLRGIADTCCDQGVVLNREVHHLRAENTRLRAVGEWADRVLEVIHEDSDSDLDETFIMQGYAAVRAWREGDQ